MKQLTLTIESRTEQLIAVRNFVSVAAQDFGFNDEEVSKIALAVDEACTNVIKHAYRFDATKRLKVTIKPARTRFEVLIADTGLRFDPNNLQTPDMREYLRNFKQGGLGVYLMKTLMDEVEYHMTPGKKNEVRLVKYLRR